jgi:hypothetical protein
MTEEEARALRHSGAKCVPHEPTPEMVDAALACLMIHHPQGAWRAMYDAAPPCECEATRLLREVVPLLAEYADSLCDDHSVGLCKCDVDRLAEKIAAYLARSKL